MKNTRIKTFTAAVVLAVFSIFFLASCQKNKSDLEEAKKLLELKDKHLGPAEGYYANGVFALRCRDLATVRYAGEEATVEHYCRSNYRLHGTNLEQLDGCYELDSADNTLRVRGSNAYLTFEGDSAEKFSVELENVNRPVPLEDMITPCHMEAKTLCVDKAARRIRLIGTDENGEECVGEGDWYGVITVAQIVHDTVVVYDTVNNTTIITIHDTVVGVDTVVRTQELACRLISWEPIANLNASGEVVVEGHAIATLRVLENGVEVLNLSTPYTVWSKWNYTGIQGVTFPDSVANHCYTITAGNAVAGGNQITTYFVSDMVADNTVMINGTDYKSQVSVFHAKPVAWCFDGVGQVAICHFDDITSEDVALYTTPYSTAAAPVRQLTEVDTLRMSCGTASNGLYSVVTNQVTYTVSKVDTLLYRYSLAPLEERVPFTTTATYTYSVNVSGDVYQSMIGMTVVANNGILDFGSFRVTMTQVGNQDFCTMTVVSGTLTVNGVVVTTEYNGGHPTVTIPVSFTQRTETGRDTVWGDCGVASNGYYSVLTNQVSYTITRTGIVTRHFNVAPLTETSTVTATATYTYSVSRSGIAYQSMVSTMPVYANGSVFDFNGYSVTMTQTGNQDFCPMSLVSAVLTNSGVTITTEYNGGYPSVTIPETIQADPTPMFIGVVYACVTTSYKINTSTTPEHWVHVLTLNNGVYTWYYTKWRSGLTLADFTSTTITASQYAVVANALAAGQGLAKVYHHDVAGATYELGTVKGTEQSGGQWKVKYYDLTGNLQNMMDFSASTFSGYNGENPIRGIMSANGSLTADGVTIQVGA